MKFKWGLTMFNNWLNSKKISLVSVEDYDKNTINYLFI